MLGRPKARARMLGQRWVIFTSLVPPRIGSWLCQSNVSGRPGLARGGGRGPGVDRWWARVGPSFGQPLPAPNEPMDRCFPPVLPPMTCPDPPISKNFSIPCHSLGHTLGHPSVTRSRSMNCSCSTLGISLPNYSHAVAYPLAIQSPPLANPL